MVPLVLAILVFVVICIYYRNRSTPTFHILIATAGRPSLRNMLDSLKHELTTGDAITIVFDGHSAKSKAGISPEWLVGHKARITLIEQTPNLGFWGHGIRNAYQGHLSPECTFVMHADDDDVYVPGSFIQLRKLCVNPDTLYITQMERVHNQKGKAREIIPSVNEMQLIKLGNIGTPNGIIPRAIAQKGEWGNFYGGDWHYYNTVQESAANVVLLDTVIYTVRIAQDQT